MEILFLPLEMWQRQKKHPVLVGCCGVEKGGRDQATRYDQVYFQLDPHSSILLRISV